MNKNILHATVPTAFSAQENQDVWLSGPPEHIHVFDEKSTNALTK